jgi:2-keto-4-pentenoate hydratase/2-oxohepta-3-ene-1,7-dioic acid hydratase in catechol pathway
MKLVTFEVATPVGPMERLGALIDGDETGRIADLTAACAAWLGRETDEPTPRELAELRCPPDMIDWLRGAHKSREAAERAVAYATANATEAGLDGERLIYARDEVRLLAPIPRPNSLRDFLTYEEHMTKADVPFEKTEHWYRTPPYYKGACDSITGPEDPIPWPYYTERLDLELEIGIVVGREGSNLTVEEARDHIAGYTILVDSSCRDGYGRETLGPTKRKDFNTALGPCLVTADAIDIGDAACSISVDGEVWFEGSTGAPRSFLPEHLVAYASDNETVLPGDVIGTGTVGFGCSMDLHKWIKLGQTATFTIDGIGAMALTVLEGARRVEHVHGMDGLLTYPGKG